MYPVQAGQIRAARAILDWSREDLAQATGLALNTIRNLERGAISPRGTTNAVIRQAIESAGLEFTEGEGIRRRSDDVKIFQGLGSSEAFLDDVRQTVICTGGGLAIMAGSRDMLAQSCGTLLAGVSERLGVLSSAGGVKCLLADLQELSFEVPEAFEFRTTSRQNIGPLPCFIYGDRHALVLADPVTTLRYVVFSLPRCARAYREHFTMVWNSAFPVSANARSGKGQKK